jgi:hypothetical protein
MLAALLRGMHAAPNSISQHVIVLRRDGVLSNPFLQSFYHCRPSGGEPTLRVLRIAVGAGSMVNEKAGQLPRNFARK